MDRGRQIDNTQNVNARWIDQFNQTNKTSVRTTNPPGGKSSFSLGWTEPEVPAPKNSKYSQNNNNDYDYDNYNYGKKNVNNNQNMNGNKGFNDNYTNNYQEKTSVRVKYAPGGQSQIVFGNESTNYDDYKKNSGASLYKK